MGRKKKDNTVVYARVRDDAKPKLDQLVVAMGFVYGDRAAYGDWLNAIADGKVQLKKIEESS